MLINPYRLALPEGWDHVALKFLADIETGSGDTQDADPDGEFSFIVRSPDPLRSSTYSYDTEAVLTAGDGNVGEIFHHIKGKFHAHQRVYVLHNFKRVIPRYCFFFFSAFFRFMAQGGEARTTVDSVRRWMLADMPFAVPPLDEQRVIADYLDRETQRIDELIAEQRGLIETLRERKVTFAERLYGIRVGEGSRLRWSLTDVDERAGDMAAELPLLSVSIDWGVRRRKVGDSKQAEGDLTKYKIARRGDIVLNRMRAFQGALGVAPEDGVVSPDYSVIRTTADIDTSWLASLMRAPAFVGEMVSRIRGIGGVESGVVRTPRLNFADLREIRVSIPSINQQRAEVETTLNRTSHTEALIAGSEDLIMLSQERRAALVTAAVTGQIDVRTGA